MPLKKGKSKKVRSQNIAELIKAGHEPAQAEAIAYKESGEDETAEAWISRKIAELIDRGYEPKEAEAVAYSERRRRDAKDDDTGKTFKIYDSARTYDINGWPEVKDNPISKVGVFPYLGRDISPDFEPEQIYNVYRPAEELSNPETISSFKLLPWTDEHTMLGSKDDGMTPPEKKGIHGVIGENVHFDGMYLKANLKIFSTKLADLIEKGKKELSIGYRCLYDIVSGVFEGVKYDAIQRNIRGNHLATVEEGRSGHDVAVLDHFKFSFDAKEIRMPDVKREGEEIQDEEMSLEQCAKMLKELAAKVDKMMNKEGDESEEGEAKKELSEKAAKEGDKNVKDEEGEYKKFVNKAEVEDDDEGKEKSKEEEAESQDDKEGDMSKPKDKKGMDAQILSLTKEVNELKQNGAKAFMREVSRRDDLARRLSEHVGTFDHADKTFDDVAAYGVKKLGLKCAAGQESAMLEGYLAAAKKNSVVAVNDSQVKSGCIEAYLNGGK